MEIGACYIVKDEAEELQKSLESVREAVDEIVVVSTAGHKGVENVAASFGAGIFSYPWHNHFAEARNFALEQAKSPWIIFLDADEAFFYPQQVRSAIEEKLEGRTDLDALMIMLHNSQPNDQGTIEGYDLVMRIFRNTPELRYTGRIHEQLEKRDGGKVVYDFTDQRLAVSHTGYAGERDAKKAERNLRLLQMDIDAAGGKVTPGQNKYLSDCYFILKDYRKALACVLSALDSDVEFVGSAGSLYHTALECMRSLQMPPEDMLALAVLASEKLPELPEFYAEQAMVLGSMGKLEQAEGLFQKSIRIYRDHSVNYRNASYFTDRVLAIVQKKLAEIYHLQGDDDKAEEYFRRALSTDPDSVPARTAYQRYLREKKGKEILLSACYIVRNEAENLRRSLESIAGEADEILVVDTGSEDETVKVAEEYGAVCSYFPWKNDFAAARNFALEQARGEWVLFLDADEYFYERPAGRLRNYLKKCSHVNLLAFLWRNIDAETGELLLDSYAPRLFRNRKEFRYEGRIHEQLLDRGYAINNIAKFPGDQLILMHTGYSKSVCREKSERNLKLLLEELRTAEHPEYLYMYLAEAYEGIGDEEAAMAYAEKDIATGRKPVAFASRSYRLLLRLLAKRPGEGERRKKAAEGAVRDFPEVPEFHAEYAECLAAEGHYEKALEELEQTEHRLRKVPEWEPVMFTDEMKSLLAERKQKWGMIMEAERILRPDYQTTCSLLMGEMKRLPGILFLLERETDEAAQKLYRSCRELLSPELRELWTAYETGENSVDSEGYDLILQAVLRYGTEHQILRWVETAQSFSPERLVSLGTRLIADEHWRAAFAAYSMVPEQAECITGDFWYHVGRCLYHLGMKADAAECMEKAIHLGVDHGGAVSWMKWIKEDMEKC